jgi:hypothetical protein
LSDEVPSYATGIIDEVRSHISPENLAGIIQTLASVMAGSIKLLPEEARLKFATDACAAVVKDVRRPLQ